MNFLQTRQYLSRKKKFSSKREKQKQISANVMKEEEEDFRAGEKMMPQSSSHRIDPETKKLAPDIEGGKDVEQVPENTAPRMIAEASGADPSPVSLLGFLISTKGFTVGMNPVGMNPYD